MKNYVILPVLSLLLFAGCQYEVPLTTEHNIPVDPKLPGVWELISEEEDDVRITILKFSDTEYSADYSVKKDHIYYRGYPIEIGGVSCVQLQVIGTHKGPPDKDDNNLFQVASYRLVKDELEISMLNGDLIKDQDGKAESLVQAFLNNRENKELFVPLGKFRRINK